MEGLDVGHAAAAGWGHVSLHLPLLLQLARPGLPGRPASLPDSAGQCDLRMGSLQNIPGRKERLH